MSYDEEQHKRSRVVVETPTARREVVQQQTVRYPERRSFSTGMVVTVALVAIAATAIVFLFLTNSRSDSTETNVNMRAAALPQPTPFAQQPVIVQTPMTAPTPIIIQAPATTTAAPPVIIQQQPATTTAPAQTTTAAAAPPAHDDASLQAKLDKAFGDDPQISAANINATVVNGRVTLIGMVPSDAVKARAESMAYKIKGVLGVDNKLVVSASTP
ncbi:MAG TPA: BON domain-containing protein [Pyrinomonadaceae bacterium]|nr:BON domain-containing protein [Pyrinomonadaceae bacterium]